MAYSYNMSTIEMVNSFKEGCIPIDTVQSKDGKEINVVVYKLQDKDTHALTNEDIFLMVKYFKTAIHVSFPRMKKLKDYIKNIVYICTKMAMPIPWILPSGAMVSESYLNSKAAKVRPFSFVNSIYTFRIPAPNKKGERYDLVQQRNYTMPNIVHSLDASTIALLYDQLKCFGISNLYTIHDCFVTTANNVENLTNALKRTYIAMYSDQYYLENFDKHLKSCIEQSIGKECLIEDYKKITIPTGEDGSQIVMNYPQLTDVIDKNASITCVY